MGSVADSVVAKIRIIIDNTNFWARKNYVKVEFFDIFILNNVKSNLKIILFLPNQVVSKIKELPFQRLYPYRKPRGAEVGQTYIHIRRNCTLWFWRSKNLAVRAKLSRTKQRERLMRCIVYSPHWLRAILSFVVNSAFYIRTQAWGFRRCSFRQLGRCQSLYCVERVTELAPRFHVYIPTIC